MRQSNFGPIEDALERLDERIKRHLGERRHPWRLGGSRSPHELLRRCPPPEYVAPGDAARGEVFARLFVLLVLEQTPDEGLARVELVFVDTGLGVRVRRWTGRSILDLMCASVAAMTRYSAARSSCMSSITARYSRYFSVIKPMGMSTTLISCFWQRWSKRSSGPSK